MGITVSVIIPVYNVEKYLDKCLQSVETQSYKDIEIIVVDDCSTDNSYNIAKTHAWGDSRIKIYRNDENKMAGGARNTGIRKSTGKYIMFLDSDDTLPADAVGVLFEEISGTGSQMSFGRMVWEKDSVLTPVTYIESMVDRFLAAENQNLRFMPPEFWAVGSAVNAIYDRDFIVKNNIWFPEFVYWEDVAFTAFIWQLASKITFTDNIVYFRTERTGESKSITQKYDFKKFADRDIITKCVFDFFNKYPENSQDRHNGCAVLKRIFNTTAGMLSKADSNILRDVERWFAKHKRTYKKQLAELETAKSRQLPKV